MFVLMFDILIFVTEEMESDGFVREGSLVRIILRIGLNLGWRWWIIGWTAFVVSWRIVRRIFSLASISTYRVRLIGILDCGCRSIVCILCLFHLRIC